MNIVFFGTPPFAAKILSDLLADAFKVSAVVTQPDRPKGRSKKMAESAVKELLREHQGIPLFQPQKASEPAFIEEIKKFSPDLFVVVAYGEIMRKALLELPKLAAINVHASLLPKYRGAAPIQHCLLNGEKESGVSIMHMVRQMDAGAVIAKEKVLIHDQMRANDLEKELCLAGSKALRKVLQDFQKNSVSVAEEQDHSMATYAHKITSEDAKIDWDLDCQTILRKIRAMYPKPGAWSEIELFHGKQRIKIFSGASFPEALSKILEPGQVLITEDQKILVRCKDNFLEIKELQLEGKKSMTAQEFIRGYASVKKLHFV